MTEQRKGAPSSLRTDPYLFGSHAHRFRSSNEFFPHAVWLLCDTSMKSGNCVCKYCSGSKTMRETAYGSAAGGRDVPARIKPVASTKPKTDPRKGATGRRVKVR